MRNLITYKGMIWLLVAQLVVMLPFAWYLPVWIIPIVLVSAGWRLWVISGGATQPSLAMKLGLLALGVGGLFASGLKFPSLEAMSALLLLGFAFKSLEVIRQRDALVVIFIGYFLVALHFLYSQSILSGFYGVMSLIVLTSALIGVQQNIEVFSVSQQVRFNSKLAASMFLQSLPLMLVLFVFAPRFQPFWTLPSVMEQAKTGISDHMSPGDIEKLSQSSELAFRVTFSGAMPSRQQLYWRGMVLNYFDGKTWRQFADDIDFNELKATKAREYAYQPNQIHKQGVQLNYEAVYEKTGQPWLFTLSPVTDVGDDVIRLADYRVMADQPLQSPKLLRASSYPEAVRDLELGNEWRQFALQLPSHGNQRSQQLAEQLYHEAGANPQAYIDKVLNRFKTQKFFYTLQPPKMGEQDTIDTFLFDAQRGFCAHYAGSFVYLMRAVGIPARMVVGYQGGSWSEGNKYLSVFQRDAHAWVEVWMANKGWVQIDPTAVIAPERIEQGSEILASQIDQGFLQTQFTAMGKVSWVAQFQQKLDAIQYGWQRWVLGYDSESQEQFFRHLLGEVTWARLAMVIIGVASAIALLWATTLGLLKHGQKEALEHQLYRRFCEVLAKRGVVRDLSQAPGDFARHAAQSLPQWAVIIAEFNQTYETLCYAGVDTKQTHSLQKQLKKLLGKFK